MEKKVKRKIAQSDFLEEQLPQSRKDQFKDILKINFWLLMKIGMLFLAAFALVFIKIYFVYFFNASANNSYNLGHITLEEKDALMRLILLISGGINVVLYPPIFIIIAGMLRIIRQLCYTEGVIFSYDFKMGVKENWKKFLVIGLLFALVELANIAIFTFFNFHFLTIIIFTLSVLVFLPTLIASTYFFSTYENKFGRGLFNSLLVHLRASWKSVIITAILVTPVLLLAFLLNIITIKLAIYFALVIVGLPILLLFGYEVYLSIFDEHINIYHFKEAVRKGLYISETEKKDITDKLKKIKGDVR